MVVVISPLDAQIIQWQQLGCLLQSHPRLMPTFFSTPFCFLYICPYDGVAVRSELQLLNLFSLQVPLIVVCIFSL